MTTLVIVADIQAKEESVTLVKAELEKLVGPTRAEKGCIQYDLNQDNDDPTHFLFFELWENRELWQVHMESAHLKAFADATEGAIKKTVISEMTQIA